MPHKHTELLEKLYPEAGAGGFTRCDGTIEFYGRVQSLLSDDSTVVDYGAGRGRFLEDRVVYRRELRRLQRADRHVIGLDIDPVVLENPAVGEAHVITLDGAWPLESSSVDAIVADWTFEHVRNPELLAEEAARVLRPGGWLCARTPNKWGTVGLPTRLIPNGWHDRVLRRVQPQKKEIDTFPTAYRMNSRKDVQRHFPVSRFRDFSYFYDCEPAYAGGSEVAWRALRHAPRALPESSRSTYMIFLNRV